MLISLLISSTLCTKIETLFLEKEPRHTKMYQSSQFLYKGVARSKDGLKAQEEYKPKASALGKDISRNWRAVSAKGRREKGNFTDSFCAYSAPTRQRTVTQGACPGLYSCWGFAPPLLITATTAQFLELSSY